VLKAVTWYKPRQEKTQTFVGSLAKRIVRDLVCDHNKKRILAAVLECHLGQPEPSSLAQPSEDETAENWNVGTGPPS
jgi:hypothetical protein